MLETIPRLAAPERINSSTVKHARYIPLVSKLVLFNMARYDGMLYLDSDTLVLGGIAELFSRHLPEMRRRGLNLGWVRDQGEQFRARSFNAGVMLVALSKSVFGRLMRLLHQGAFEVSFAEQGLLNTFFGHHSYELDQQFNLLTTVPREHRTLYASIKHDVRIFHSTCFKPTCSFYLVRCFWHGTHDFCREWQGLEALQVKV